MPGLCVLKGKHRFATTLRNMRGNASKTEIHRRTRAVKLGTWNDLRKPMEARKNRGLGRAAAPEMT